ncbi:hypothetical protein [Ramlibacter sp.]|uniref:hypothetical protein n=1 Tax=Ramlibacter sp. TaxID=1917967 RepID=UPI003D10B668
MNRSRKPHCKEASHVAAGDEVIHFSGSWGIDIVRDADASRSLVVEGVGAITGAGAFQVAGNAWQTEDQSVNYTLVDTGTGRSDLFITFNPRPDVICVEGWTPRNNVGIALPGVGMGSTGKPPRESGIVGWLHAHGTAYEIIDAHCVAGNVGAEPGADEGSEVGEGAVGHVVGSGNDSVFGELGVESVESRSHGCDAHDGLFSEESDDEPPSF